MLRVNCYIFIFLIIRLPVAELADDLLTLDLLVPEAPCAG